MSNYDCLITMAFYERGGLDFCRYSIRDTREYIKSGTLHYKNIKILSGKWGEEPKVSGKKIHIQKHLMKKKDFSPKISRLPLLPKSQTRFPNNISMLQK